MNNTLKLQPSDSDHEPGSTSGEGGFPLADLFFSFNIAEIINSEEKVTSESITRLERVAPEKLGLSPPTSSETLVNLKHTWRLADHVFYNQRPCSNDPTTLMSLPFIDEAHI